MVPREYGPPTKLAFFVVLSIYEITDISVSHSTEAIDSNDILHTVSLNFIDGPRMTSSFL